MAAPRRGGRGAPDRRAEARRRGPRRRQRQETGRTSCGGAAGQQRERVCRRPAFVGGRRASAAGVRLGSEWAFANRDERARCETQEGGIALRGRGPNREGERGASAPCSPNPVGAAWVSGTGG